MSVFDMNVRYDNADLTGVAAQIQRDQPNLVTLEEIGADQLRLAGEDRCAGSLSLAFHVGGRWISRFWGVVDRASNEYPGLANTLAPAD